MPPMRLPLAVRLGGIRSLLAFAAVMTGGLVASFSPVAAAAWAPGLLPVSMLLAIVGAGGIGYYLWRGFSARRLLEQALRHYARVTYDYEATELHARLIPEGETRGAHVMAHYRWFRDEYESLTRSWQDLGSPRGAQWFEPGVFQRVSEIERRSAALDSTDDIIAGNAAFLSLSSNWERLWREEQQPVLHDLNLLLVLCQQIDSQAFTPGGTVEAREQVRAHHQRLTEMTTELAAGQLQPSAALDELAWIAADVRRAGSSLALRVTGAGRPLGGSGAGMPPRSAAHGSPGIVGSGRHDEHWQLSGGNSALHASTRPYAQVRAGFLGDGTFPGY